MPRGIAIPQLRQQLFAAAERVVLREGPARLSGRAVTVEAGVAAGLLYAHFSDLDDFLTAYAVDRAFTVSAAATALPERAGEGAVAANLLDAFRAIPWETLTALAKLLVLRPDLVARIHAVLGEKTAGLDAVERSVAAYLTAEQRLGRVPKDAAPGATALALVAVLHHLALTEANGDRLEGVVAAAVPVSTGRLG